MKVEKRVVPPVPAVITYDIKGLTKDQVEAIIQASRYLNERYSLSGYGMLIADIAKQLEAQL